MLAAAGFGFAIDPADIDEIVAPGEDPLLATVRLAIEKAEAVAARHPADAVVLGADTSVVVGDRMLGKPRDGDDACAMLLSLSGRNHRVITGWALVGGRAGGSAVEGGGGVGALAGAAISIVRMREISLAEARAYACTDEPGDKAGAYAVQGEGRRFIGAVVGCIRNVIGLPVDDVACALSKFGIEPESRQRGISV